MRILITGATGLIGRSLTPLSSVARPPNNGPDPLTAAGQ